MAHRWSLTQAYCALVGKIGQLVHRGPPPAPPRPIAASAQPVIPIPGGPAPIPQRAMLPGGRPAPTPQALPPAPVIQRQSPDPSGSRLKGELMINRSEQRTADAQAALYQVEIHKKYSIAASCLVFVLIGAPVALRFPRGGVGLVIGASVFIFGVYYVGLIGGETLADATILSPFWAMWGPNLLMTAVGLVMFARLGYEHATTRGGGWGDRFKTLGGKLLFWRRDRA